LTLITDKKNNNSLAFRYSKTKNFLFLYKPIQQKVLKKADKIIATSPQYLETSKQIKNFKDKAIVVPLGLNPKRLR
jgi:hypothetical protein